VGARKRLPVAERAHVPLAAGRGGRAHSAADARTQAVVDAGALPLLVAVMRAHAGNAAVQGAACGVLCNLAYKSDTLRSAVVDAGALPLLVAAMRAHAGSAAVQETACVALWNVARDSRERARRVASAGALPLVDAALKAHKSQANVKKWGGKLARQPQQGVTATRLPVSPHGPCSCHSGTAVISFAVGFERIPLSSTRHLQNTGGRGAVPAQRCMGLDVSYCIFGPLLVLSLRLCAQWRPLASAVAGLAAAAATEPPPATAAGLRRALRIGRSDCACVRGARDHAKPRRRTPLGRASLARRPGRHGDREKRHGDREKRRRPARLNGGQRTRWGGQAGAEPACG
jgi:hypothetical protein